MKQTINYIALFLFVVSCNSNYHEAYIAKFKHDFDNKINSCRISRADSLRILSDTTQSLAEFRAEKIANDRFYIDNYSWYQLGKNLMLSPAKAKEKAIKNSFYRPFYFLEYLRNDTVQGVLKKELIDDLRIRLYARYKKDSIQIMSCSSSDLFRAVKRFEKSKYFFFLKVDFEKVKFSNNKQKRVAAQMLQGALKRLQEKVEIRKNRYHLTIHSGEEIGISENLFLIGKNMYEQMNRQLNNLVLSDPEYFAINNLAEHQRIIQIKNWEQAIQVYELYGNDKDK